MKLLILATFLLFSLVVSSFRTEQTTASIDNDEYEVLSALVNEIYLKENAKSIVITNPTCCAPRTDVHSDSWKVYLDQLGPESFDTLDDYAARNKQSLSFEKRFKLKADYQIVPYAEVQRLFSSRVLDDAWKTFYSKYPESNGYLRLSRVGFNKAKDQALVSTGWMRGELAGEGYFVLLGKQDGSWKVLKRAATWMV